MTIPRAHSTPRGPLSLALLLLTFLALTACGDHEPKEASAAEVVLYSSIDEPDLRPVIDRFEKETGITVRVVTDTEATKTTVLAERLEAEKDRPQADVYWNNEIFHVIDLARKGLFVPYRPTTAEDVPTRWRDDDDLYTCVGVRFRTIACSSRPGDKAALAAVSKMEDLVDPAFRDRIAMCHPGFGTATGHVAALYVSWGEERYRRFMTGLRDNHVKLLGGNAAVTEQIGLGRLVIGPTDNDDVDELREEGLPVDGVIPGQADGGEGTLLMPGAVALVKGGAHPEAARKLVDFLCDASVEKELIEEGYLAYSVRDEIPLVEMKVDFQTCAKQMRRAIEIALEIIQNR